MKNFGIILNHFRVKSNISMAVLAKDICSKHYIYLIEHGKRIPSVKMVDELSSRLNFDWREYVDFADNPSPIKAKSLMDEFRECAKNYDFTKLISLLENLPNDQWTVSYPMNIEVMLQKMVVCIFYNNSEIKICKGTLTDFEKLVEPLLSEPNYSVLSLINFRTLYLYARLLIKKDKAEEAFDLYKKLYNAMKLKTNIERYQSTYISIAHGLILCCAKVNNYKMMNSLSIKLLNFQEDKCLMSKVPVTLTYIGDSYKYIGKKSIAYRFYKRAVTVSKITKSNFLLERAEKNISQLY